VRQFAQKGFAIYRLSLEAKILYSAFLVFSLAAMVVSALYYNDLVGGRAVDGAKEYYAGEAPGSGNADASPQGMIELSDKSADKGTSDDIGGDGPAITLPPDELEVEEAQDSGPILLTMTWRKLLEVTHFHLFTLPVFLLIISHLFALCGMRPSVKVGIIVSGSLSSGVHMAAPWVIFYGGASWAWLMPVTGTWMAVSMVVMILWPAWAMWKRPKESSR